MVGEEIGWGCGGWIDVSVLMEMEQEEMDVRALRGRLLPGFTR